MEAVRMIFLRMAALALCTGGLSGQAIAADLSQAISSDERLTLFSGAAAKTGLSGILKEPGPFVVFIPSDQAMINEGSAFLLNGVLLTAPNAGRLADLVQHHVVRASRQTVELADVVELQTLANVPLDVARVGTGITVGHHAAITGRIVADNGVVYIVDRLLWPRDSLGQSSANVASELGQVREARAMVER
jgi:uncharacterized surface protein with fasciclin (FAS1) repeats